MEAVASGINEETPQSEVVRISVQAEQSVQRFPAAQDEDFSSCNSVNYRIPVQNLSDGISSVQIEPENNTSLDSLQVLVSSHTLFVEEAALARVKSAGTSSETNCSDFCSTSNHKGKNTKKGSRKQLSDVSDESAEVLLTKVVHEMSVSDLNQREKAKSAPKKKKKIKLVKEVVESSLGLNVDTQQTFDICKTENEHLKGSRPGSSQKSAKDDKKSYDRKKSQNFDVTKSSEFVNNQKKIHPKYAHPKYVLKEKPKQEQNQIYPYQQHFHFHFGQQQHHACYTQLLQSQSNPMLGSTQAGQHRQQQQISAGKKKKRPPLQQFESYWTKEQIAEGLKRGLLIEGKFRINPKNYEDCYVPLPDFSSDIYICGMTNRNRALDGDIVAVSVNSREDWRVFTDELECYEKQNKVDEEAVVDNREEAPMAEEIPDVVVEEEEMIELDENGQQIGRSTVTSFQNLIPQTSQDKGSSSKYATPKEDINSLSPNSAKKASKYVSVKEIMECGSPVAKRLFTPADCVGIKEEDTEFNGKQQPVNIHRFMQQTGKVVAIIEKKHSRSCGGSLRNMQEKNPNFALFSPTDSRVPRILIPLSEVPQGFKERPGDFANVLYIARITEWSETSKFPKGTLARSLGEAGQIEPETEALLIENDVDSSDFTEEVEKCLPQEKPWTIPASEFEYRRDFRKECVFTIDPSTARDLDDALSCRHLGDGVYEVGVHIADVSYFVKEGTQLDEVARSRATTVYLVQKVIPMLPRLLCEQLCSLNPDEDRLSFSVVWKMTDHGEILEEWFGRTVIRSCVKLSYDHAQGFISEPDREWTTEELPNISGGFTVEDIKSRVLIMDKMAKAMRKARFDSGALRLDQVKIQFTLNKDTGLPNGYFVYEQRDSNKLVEEFMLLANMAVAHRIKAAFQEKALLRRHPPPQSRMIDDLKETCESLGLPVEVNTAKDLQRSLNKYIGEDELSKARLQVLVVLCSKPMQNAKYFCCGVLADETLYHHYALNVPLYTHFTSPIRRYPDVMVHRTLAAALGYCEVTSLSSTEIQHIASHCNDKKLNAKRCSDLSNELYFSVFVKEAGPLEEKGMVMAVLNKSFDVYVLKFGVVKRVYCEKLPLQSFSFQKDGKRLELTLVWKPDDGCPRAITQKLSIFSMVQCILKADDEQHLRWSASIRAPVEEIATMHA